MLREAIEELKKHCLDHECEGCEFYDSEIEQCALILPPCDWEPAWTSELRPCPFCGGTVHIPDERQDGSGRTPPADAERKSR